MTQTMETASSLKSLRKDFLLREIFHFTTNALSYKSDFFLVITATINLISKIIPQNMAQYARYCKTWINITVILLNTFHPVRPAAGALKQVFWRFWSILWRKYMVLSSFSYDGVTYLLKMNSLLKCFCSCNFVKTLL